MPPISNLKKARRLKAYKSHEVRRSRKYQDKTHIVLEVPKENDTERSRKYQDKNHIVLEVPKENDTERSRKYQDKNHIVLEVPKENDTEFYDSQTIGSLKINANTYVSNVQMRKNIPEKSAVIASTSEHGDNCVEELMDDVSAPFNVEIAEPSTESSRIEGRRIVNIKTFFANLQEISKHGPLNCGLESVEIVSEKQIGYNSKFTLQCKLCNIKFYINNEEGSEMDINNCAVLGTIATGCGQSQLQELSAALDLPLITSTLYNKCHNNVANLWDKISTKAMIDAGLEEKQLAIKEGRIDINGTPLVDVIVDGCWSKRTYKKNYSALSGAAVIIGKKTGKILYMGVKNKYCSICALAGYKNFTPNEHKCFRNYCGPSTGMESSILVEGFKCSISMHGLIYERMISDGDSSTYSKIIETRPYPNTTVQKIECKNHIMRNLCNKLMQLKTDTKYPVRHRKNITDQKIIAIRSTVKKAIIKHTSESESEKRAHVELLYSDILRAHVHAFGDHSVCKRYFCNKINEDQDQVEGARINEFRTTSLWSKICQIMSNVASHAPSLIHNVESNKAENFNGIIAKLVGGKRINYSLRGSYQNRCKGAVISYNTRKLLSTTYKSATGYSPRGNIKKLEQRKLSILRTKNKSKKIKRTRKINFMGSKGEDVHYGENCAKEDISPEIMEIEKNTYLNNLKRSKEEREHIERATVLQSSCSEWLELRRKLLTASNFGRVIKRRPNTNCSSLVKDLLYKESISHVKSIKHGLENEKVAIALLSKQAGIKIKSCGLFIDENLPYLGATPDGIAGDDMIVEVKCPASAYKLQFEDAVKKKKIPFYKIDKDGKNIINTQHNWYYQIQGQLHITKKSKCLFGIWLGDNIPIKTDIIIKDDKFWSEVMEEKLTKFYLECMLPELIDPRHPRKMEIRNPNQSKPNETKIKRSKCLKKASEVRENAEKQNIGSETKQEKKRKLDIKEQDIEDKENRMEGDNNKRFRIDKTSEQYLVQREKIILQQFEEENKEMENEKTKEQDMNMINKYSRNNESESSDEDIIIQSYRCRKNLSEKNLNFSEF